MDDNKKTKKQLIEELKELRQCVVELKGFDEEIKQPKVNQEKFTIEFLRDSIPMSITTLKEGRFVDVSDAFLRQMGRKRDEVVGHTSKEIVFTEDQRASFFNELNNRGRIENLEMEVRTKGGALRHGLFNVVMMNINNEKYLLTVMTDITERKQAEEALRESDEKYRNLFDNAAEGIYQVTPNGRFISANPAAARILGYESPEELIGTITDIGSQVYAYPEDREKAVGLLRKDGFFKNLEVRNRQKNGSIIWVLANVHAVRDDHGNILYHEGTSRDITKRKQAEEALRKSEALFRSYFDMPLHGIAITSPEKGWLQVNDRICSILGYSRDEIVRMTWAEMTHPDDLAADVEQFNRILSGQIEQYTMDKRFLRKDGKVIWSSIAVGCVRESDGRVDYIVALMEDITKRKQAEEALHRTEENFRRSVDDSPLGVRIATTEGETIYANRAILDIHGYESFEDLISTPVKKRYTPESYAEFKIRREKRKRGDYGPSEYEISIVRKNGEVRYLQVFRKRVLWGGERQFQVIYQDITDRKRAEKTLQLITDNMSDIIRVTDLQGVNLYTSPSLFNVLGYKPEERVDKSAFDIVHPDDVEHLIKVFSEGIISKKPAKLEYRIKHANGHYVWLETIGDLLMDDHGEVTAVIQSSRDITERKKVEEALRISQKQLRDAHRLAHIGVWNWIADTDTVTWTEELYRIAGLDPMLPAPTYKEHPNIYTPESWNRLKVAVEKAIETGELYQLELELIRPDGTTRRVNAFGGTTYDNHGRVTGLQGTVQDITDQKRAEEALQESEGRFRQVTEKLQEAVWSADLSGKYDFLSPNVAKIYCRPLSEMMANPALWIEAAHPADQATVRASHDALIRDSQIELEYRIVLPDGTERWICDRKTVLLDMHGKPSKIAGILSDITDRKQAEADKEKLAAQNQQLQKAESLGRMAGAIAHTFNNKLAVVMGNLEMAMDKLPQGTGPVENLTAAMQAVGKAAEVSGLMLTYLGQTPGKREPLDISDVCLKNLPLLQSAIPNNVVMEADLPTPGPTISANANQTQQVLTNLITNAWEAVGKNGGSIHLRVKTVSLAEIPIVHRNPIDWQPQDNAYACLEVTDTGCGIEDEYIEKIFDPFFSSKFTGRGMGLAIVMGIVRAHGGVITVESEPGRGSALRVFFPVSVEEVLRQPDKAAQPLATEGGGTVLLVEDEEMVRNMATAMLTRLGFSVLKAKDGGEAVEMFRQHQDEIRCVLTDLTMPHMNGWETLTALRKLAPDIPVILASGYDKAHVMAGDHPELPQVFLGKPYKLKGLSDAISQALYIKKK